MARTVVVAEDDASIRALLIEALASEEFRAIGTGDGASALDLIQEVHPDLVIVDVHMPRLDGIGLIERLRDQGFGDIPVLVMSARSRPAGIPETYFVPKPFDIDHFLERVNQALERYAGAPRHRSAA